MGMTALSAALPCHDFTTRLLRSRWAVKQTNPLVYT